MVLGLGRGAVVAAGLGGRRGPRRRRRPAGRPIPSSRRPPGREAGPGAATGPAVDGGSWRDAMPGWAAPPTGRCACRGPALQLQTGYRCNLVATGGRPEKGGHVHIPDGFINAPTSLAAGAVAAGGVGVSLRRAAQTLQERAGAPGRAGRRLHLRRADAQLPGGRRDQRAPARRRPGRRPGRALGGRAVRGRGPARPGLLFADGGLTALGLNIINMALVTAFGGYAVFLAAAPGCCRRPGPRWSSRPAIAAGSRWCWPRSPSCSSTPSAGPAAPRSATVVAAMVGVHTLIGIGEGDHHRPDRRRRPRRPARPGLRGPRPPAAAGPAARAGRRRRR